MRKTKLIRMSKNRSGGIEGLPLQLMIVILVATMGTAILVGWMGSVDSPQSIGAVDVISGDIVTENGHIEGAIVEVYVTDQDGDPLEGATVVLSGLGVRYDDGSTAYCTTDSDGYALFDGLTINLRNSAIGYITVNASLSDYGENNSARVAVIA